MTSTREQLASEQQACHVKQSEHLRELIRDLALNGTSPYDQRLWQVFAAHRREIDRKLRGDEGSAKVFKESYVAWIVVISVFSEHIERLSTKQSRGLSLNSRDTDISRCLGRALDDIEAACYEFRARFNVPDLKIKLASRIFFRYAFTAQEAEELASSWLADTTQKVLSASEEAA